MNRIDILRLIQKQWPDAHLILPLKGSSGNLVIIDEHYHVPDESEIDGLIHWRKWYQAWTMPSYKPDTFDCDDFALECYRDVRGAYPGDESLSLGWCLIPGHTLNFMLTQQGAWMYDYRADKLWEATSNDQPYFWMI